MVVSTNPKTQGAREVFGSIDISQITAYGDVLTAQLTPLIQLQYPYNVNTRIVMRLITGSASGTVADSTLSVATGTTTGSTAMVMSQEVAKYHPGQGSMTRFTAAFTAGVAGTTQEIGYGLVTDGFFFGFDGADLGVLRRSGGMREVQTLTITSGAVTASGDIRITLDGQTNDVTIALNDTVGDVVRKIVAETDWNTVGEGWTVEANGDEVIFRTFDSAAKTGTFSITDVSTTTGVAGSFAETIVGMAPTDTWTRQVDWNLDKMDGTGLSGMTIDPTKGNVYFIQFQWLGFGAIRFCVESDIDGDIHVVHQINYTNQNIIPSVQNPTLPLHCRVTNGATTSNIVIKTASGAVFTEGKDLKNGITFSADNTKSLTDTTETVILVIKNKTVYQGVENRVSMLPLLLSINAVGSAAAKNHTIRIYLNPILGGIPSFTDVSTNTSIAAFDTAATTVSEGTKVVSISLGQIDSDTIRLEELIREIRPGNFIVVTAQITQDTSDVEVSGVWRELF